MQGVVSIDATGGAGQITPATVLAGLPLVSRLVRQAERAGRDGARVHVSSATRPAVERALRWRGPRHGLRVELTDEPAPADSFSSLALYDNTALGGEPAAPLFAIESRRDLARARDHLHASTRKSITQDGFFAVTTQRPIARPIMRLLLWTPVRPNHVTLCALAMGLVAAAFAFTGDATLLAIGGVLYWGGAVVDCIDGDLARLRLEGSKSGEVLDSITDDVSTFALMAGLASHAGPGWEVAGYAGAAVGFLTQAYLYGELHRRRLPIDTAQYPWFFGTPSEGGAAKSRSLFGTLFYAVSMLFRRDAFVTGIGILLLFDLRRPSLAIMLFGVAVVGVLLVVHKIVMRARASRGA